MKLTPRSRLLVCSILIGCIGAAPVASACAQSQADSSYGDGWVSLFDGKSLKGWTTVGGRYDGQARWEVEDGCLVGREGPGRAGGLIYTDGEYADFEIEFDAWITYPFDSGVFARMVPAARGVQVTLNEIFELCLH